VQDRRCQMKAAAIGIARNGQHAGSQRGTPPQNRHSTEKNRHSTGGSAGPAAADWTETEAELAEAAILAERNNDTEMETSGIAPPVTQ
jgi:hypothetical protein